MMTKIKSTLIAAVIVLGGLLGFSSCTTDEHYEIIEEGAQVKTFFFEVYNAEEKPDARDKWYWNNDLGRHECIIDVREITQYIFEEGVLHASLFFDEGNYESLNSLPFIRTYYDNESNEPFEETFGYDIALGESGYYTVCFYIQSSNGLRYAPPYYSQFKLSMVWR